VTWWVYVLTSETRGTTYVGCTNDLVRRLKQHNGELSGGGKYTRIGRPWVLAKTYGPVAGRSEAQVLEHKIKKLRGRARLHWA